jgi:hypothetical protein
MKYGIKASGTFRAHTSVTTCEGCLGKLNFILKMASNSDFGLSREAGEIPAIRV